MLGGEAGTASCFSDAILFVDKFCSCGFCCLSLGVGLLLLKKSANNVFLKQPFVAQDMESEMAMELCIDEKVKSERERLSQS